MTSNLAFSPASPRPAFYTDNNEDVLRFAVNAFDRGMGVALATLVEIRGGSARSLGSQMAIREDGLYCGFVSGGCTEGAVAAEAVAAISKNLDRFVRLGEGSPFFDIRLPCGGGINISVHVLRDSGPLATALRQLDDRLPAALLYSPGDMSLKVVPDQQPSAWIEEGFVTSYKPALKVVVAGRKLEVEAIRNVAGAAGYEVAAHIIGEDPPPIGLQLDENIAVALLYHDLDLETPILAGCLAQSPFYIGALGSSRTHTERIQRLSALGFDEGQIARIRAPIGLFPKARDARTLALSVVAEIAAARQSPPRE